MADEILQKVHDLSDVELAALICLVAKEHCIIDTEPDSIDDLVQELELVCSCCLLRRLLLISGRSPLRCSVCPML